MMSNQLRQEQVAQPLPSSTLENYANTLTNILKTVSTARHLHLPNLINNSLRPIQNRNNNTLSIDQLTQTWKDDSQDLINDLSSIRNQIAQADQVLRYVKSSTTVNPSIGDEMRIRTVANTAQIIQKIKQEHQQKQQASRSKPRSSLSLSAKSGLPVDHELIEKETARWLKLKRLKNHALSSTWISPTNPANNSSNSERTHNLKEIIISINQFNQEENLLKWISTSHILLKNVMRVCLAYKPHSQNLIIERVSCFGIDESPQAIYHTSSFSLFRSITRCINHTISQFSTDTRFPSKDKANFQNQSNLILVCSLVSSYKDLFTTELTNMRVKTIEATAGGKGPQYIKRSRDPRLIKDDADRRDVYTTQTIPVSGKPNDVISETSRWYPHRRLRNEFLTWRRWSVDDNFLDSLSLESQQSHSSIDSQSDPIHTVLSRGKWVKIPEIC